ncbi:hypothetical protein niasHT_003159 [Heterodera trifolii]|uniref:RNA-directed DNA polymerase n=1 Tax=Heterodera trifolii TaxID=157864 RepID=A0ABD2M417_9BILA
MKNALPNKVIGFEGIRISYIDHNVVAFLNHFRHLFIVCCGTNLAIEKISGRISHNICSMVVWSAHDLCRLRQQCAVLSDCRALRSLTIGHFSPEFPAIYDSASANVSNNGQSLAKWLFISLVNGPPKLLRCHIHSKQQWSAKMDGFKTAFVNASSPANFIVVFSWRPWAGDTVVPFELTNKFSDGGGELMTLKQYESNRFLLVRCPLLRDQRKWTEWEREAHASRSLTPAEKNYSQIEKEGLALIFADFDIEYVNTNDFGQADALSRLIAKEFECDDERVIAACNIDEDLGTVLDMAKQILPIKFENLVSESKKDKTMQIVMKFVRDGWPDERKLTPQSEEIELFGRRKADLTILKDCLMYGERIVIPEKFRTKILTLLHKGHPGIKRMKQLARQYVFWPKLDQQIEEFVKNCAPCQLAAKAPTKTDLHSWPKSTRPWQRIHADYAGPFFGKEFLIVVDSYSKYPEVFEMTTKSAAATIERLRYLFTRHGIPETLVTDNGTQFAASEFAKFTEANGITHLFSAPYNPMSNGQAERFVDTFKRAFRKIKGEGVPNKEIINTFLVTYRTTPNDSLPEAKTPAEMLLGRKPRTTIDLLMPPLRQPTERDTKMEHHFNRRFGTRPQKFVSNKPIWARHRLSQNWRAGTISNGHEPLNVLNEAFHLPITAPNVGIVEQDLEPRPDPINDDHQDEIEPEQARRSPTPPQQVPRRSGRNRRAPDRYSPG